MSFCPRVALASLCLLLASPGAIAESATMATAADAILAQPAAARAHWGISIVDAATGTTLYAKNDAELFEPASNAKLFTTATALALLGPTYTMSTRVLAEGTVDAAGTLHGDLRLVGGGDPTMSGRVYPYAGRTERPNPPLAALDTLASEVLASGIRSVDGPVLADDTLFPDERYGAGWGWDDLQWEYGAPVSALTLNDNVRYLTVDPGAAAGAPVAASWLPAIAGLPNGSPDALQISATTSPAGTKPALGVTRSFDGARLRIYGTLPAGGPATHLAIAITDPARFAADAFRAALATAGVSVTGTAAPVHGEPQDTTSFAVETHLPLALQALPPHAHSLPPAGAGARIVALRDSPTLDQVVTVTNKVSQNLHAEILLRLLGHAEGTDGSAAEGARVVRSFLTANAGIAPEDFLLYDGSGLSPQDLVTPRAITTLLRYSTQQTWGPILRNSLPSSGVDGTLSSRFPTLRGRVDAKTGTLGEVDALSGFLAANSGRLVIFSILCNDHVGGGARALVDSLVEAAAQNF